jgi:catechol 2,3-dioxygenase-like lactoylglutathione lyase family enzyme
MKIVLTSVYVNDQQKALDFYTKVLGFIKKNDIPMGEARWLTVVSRDGPADVELLLELLGLAEARTFQRALREKGIPLASFGVDDIQAEYERLRALGVAFSQVPMQAGPVKMAVFDDTCGNLIQIVQV